MAHALCRACCTHADVGMMSVGITKLVENMHAIAREDRAGWMCRMQGRDTEGGGLAVMVDAVMQEDHVTVVITQVILVIITHVTHPSTGWSHPHTCHHGGHTCHHCVCHTCRTTGQTFHPTEVTPSHLLNVEFHKVVNGSWKHPSPPKHVFIAGSPIPCCSGRLWPG
jgi:hypothetical protein